MKARAVSLLALVVSSPLLWAGGAVGRWEKRPLPPFRDQAVADMVIEPGGVLWVTTSWRKLYYWDGERFAVPLTGELTFDYHFGGLHGGPDRGAYVALYRRGKEQAGSLYRLSDGRAEHVTDYEHRLAHTDQRPILYVSRSGKLFHWGEGFLAVYSGGAWKRTHAKVIPTWTEILDAGKTVHFYHDGRIYSVDAADNVAEREIPLASRFAAPAHWIRAALLGHDRMLTLAYGKLGLRVHDLKTGNPVALAGLDAAFGKKNAYDVFRAADGAAWVLVGEPGRYAFHRVRAEGQVSRMVDTGQFDWVNNRCWGLPRSVLNASDGSIWFGLPRGGVARWKDGTVHVFDWKDGLSEGRYSHLAEDPKGRIYTAGRGTIYVFHPGEAPSPPVADAALWTAFRLLRPCEPLRDFEGNLWMFLKDHAGKLSRWDGQAWQHLAVPFGASGLYHMLADDRGRILVAATAGCFSITTAGAQRHDSFEAMLEFAVRTGARRFETGTDFEGCLALEGGRISFRRRNARQTSHFDGKLWGSFAIPYDSYGLYESPAHGLLLGSGGRAFYAYARGQVAPLDLPRGVERRWLLGPKGVQPFEEELARLRPGVYLPVEGDWGSPCVALVPDPTSKHGYVRGEPLPRLAPRALPGFHGGHWVGHYDASGPSRVFGPRVFACDFLDSPVAGSSYVWPILDDRARNLWIAAEGRVFFKRLNGFRLKLGDVPREAGKLLRITAEPALPGLAPEQLRLFWRLGGGPWLGGEPGGSATVLFPTPGEHQIELVGLDRQGGASVVERVSVNARFEAP